MPRVVNLALALFFLTFLVPLGLRLGDQTTSVKVLLVLIAIPFSLLTIACLASAARPGCLGRTARRLR